MKKNTIIFYIVCCCMFLFSNVHAQSCKIEGVINSISDSLSLPGVSIQVLDPDSIIMASTFTDTKGYFELQIKISKELPFLLFKASYMNNIPYYSIIRGNTKKLDMGILYLNDNVELNSITIIGSNIIEMPDKMIVIPNTIQRKAASNSLNLLNNLNLPGMSVNIVTQSVTVDGLVPVYLINGRRQSQEHISAINPNDILRVEYSNSPTARYMNENAGGVINIILKEKESGGNAYMNVLVSPFTGFVNGTANFSYNYKKSEFSILYNNNWRDYSKRIVNQGESYINDQTTISQTLNGLNSPFGYLSQDIDLSYTYMHSSNTMFNATLKNGIGAQHDEGKWDVYRRTDNIPFEELFRQTKYKFNSYVPSLDLFYSHQFKKGQSIEANLVGTLINSYYDRSLVDDYLLSVHNRVDNRKRSFIAEATYRKTFGKLLAWSLGAKHNYNNTQNAYANDIHTELKVNDTYFYTQLVGQINKLSYNIGGGFKAYNVNDNIENRSFYRPMVTANLIYPFGNNFRANYRFQQNPTLPSLMQLSEVTQNYDSLYAVRGNPYLDPYNTIMNRLLLTFSKNNFKTNFWLSYYHSGNPISPTVYWDKSSNLFISQYMNQKKNDKLNVQLDLVYNSLLNHINISVFGGWQKFNSRGADYNHTLYNLYWSTNIAAYYKNISLAFNYAHPQKSLNSEVISLAENYSNIMLMYKRDRLTMSLGVFYPFEKHANSSSWTLYKAYSSSRYVSIKDNGNMLVFGLTYYFNFGNKFKKNQKGLNNADNETGILRVQ